jgi:excisionase family DNA binding protein
MAEREFLTTRELAERWGLHVKTVRRFRLRNKKPLPSYRFGREYRFRVAHIEAWEEGMRVLHEADV